MGADDRPRLVRGDPFLPAPSTRDLFTTSMERVMGPGISATQSIGVRPEVESLNFFDYSLRLGLAMILAPAAFRALASQPNLIERSQMAGRGRIFHARPRLRALLAVGFIVMLTSVALAAGAGWASAASLQPWARTRLIFCAPTALFVFAAIFTMKRRAAAVADALIVAGVSALTVAAFMVILTVRANPVTLYLTAGFSIAHLISCTRGLAEGVADGLLMALLLGATHQFISAPFIAAGDDILLPSLAAGAAAAAGVFRLPFYLVEVIINGARYCLAREGAGPDVSRSVRSPLFRDELLVLPQPRLSARLVGAARKDLATGLVYIAMAASNPFQRWAATRAARKLLDEGVSLKALVRGLIQSESSSGQAGWSAGERRRAEDPFYAARLLLVELAGERVAQSPAERCAYLLTFWLRPRRMSNHAAMARVYLALFEGGDSPTEVAFQELARARALPCGEEFYRLYAAFRAALACETVSDIARARGPVGQVLSISDPLNREVFAGFLLLDRAAEAAVEISRANNSYTRHSRLCDAERALSEVAARACYMDGLDRELFQQCARRWRAVLTGECISDIYVTHRALRPGDLGLFVGREEFIQSALGELAVGRSLIISGEAKIGKSSALLHLEARAAVRCRVVHCDLNHPPVSDAPSFVYDIAARIDRAVRSAAGHMAPPMAERQAFERDPALAFDQHLGRVEAATAGGEGLLICFDFHSTLSREPGGADGGLAVIEDIFRRCVAEGRRSQFIFCGLDPGGRLGRLSSAAGARGVDLSIGPLDSDSCRLLITSPAEGFDLRYEAEAVTRIAELSGGRPYVVQQLCRAVIDEWTQGARAGAPVSRACVDRSARSAAEALATYFACTRRDLGARARREG